MRLVLQLQFPTFPSPAKSTAEEERLYASPANEAQFTAYRIVAPSATMPRR